MEEHRLCLGDMEMEFDTIKTSIESFFIKDFTLRIDTKNISNIKCNMVLDFARFLFELKKKPKFLKRTKIYIYESYIYDLIYYLFSLTYPIAPVDVFLYNKEGRIDIIKTFYP